jgi:hypothetical protein
MMEKANQGANWKNTEYAAAADFCRIFNEDMSSLYLLSLLLTGSHEKAEQCFVGGLDDALGRNRVFKEWVRSWSRRVIIQNALRTINPQPGQNKISIDNAASRQDERAEIAAVLRLQPFDRFVFVMSVLEGYSDHDCAILLGCTVRDVLAARAGALQNIGASAESNREMAMNAGLLGRDGHQPVSEIHAHYAKSA